MLQLVPLKARYLVLWAHPRLTTAVETSGAALPMHRRLTALVLHPTGPERSEWPMAETSTTHNSILTRRMARTTTARLEASLLLEITRHDVTHASRTRHISHSRVPVFHRISERITVQLNWNWA